MLSLPSAAPSRVVTATKIAQTSPTNSTSPSNPNAPSQTRPASDLDTVVRSLPPGQKAAQVLLGKLIEAAR